MFPDPTNLLEAACARYTKRVIAGSALLIAAGFGMFGRGGRFSFSRGQVWPHWFGDGWGDVAFGVLGTAIVLGAIPPLVRANAQLRRWRAFVASPEFAKSFARSTARGGQGRTRSRAEQQGPPPSRKPLLDLRKRALLALGLDEHADAHAIRRRHRELVLAFHPDRQLHLPPEQQAAAAERFHEIQRAYEFLRS